MKKKNTQRIINIDEFREHPTDTGSAGVQVATLTQEIGMLLEHFKNHPKDFASQRGMVQKVSDRKKSLAYLEKKDPVKYKIYIERLGIRK